MASQRGDFYQGLYLGKLDEKGGERVIVNFRFPEKNTTANATWWFDSSIESQDYFFKNFFGTELKSIIITHNGKMIPYNAPLKELFPLEFELTFDVRFLKKTKNFCTRSLNVYVKIHKMNRLYFIRNPNKQ